MKKHKLTKLRGGRKYISDCGKRANTRHLTRIITILSEMPEGTFKTNLVNIGVSEWGFVSDALNWMVANGIISIVKPKGVKIYKINKEFLKLRKNGNK